MALNLRKAIFRTAIINAACVFGAGLLPVLFFSQFNMSSPNLVWLLLLTLCAGIGGGWYKSAKLAKSMLPGVDGGVSYQPVQRDTLHEGMINGLDIDWGLLDDYGMQLRNLGYSHLGDFTAVPAARDMASVCACYIDSSAAMLVEVQFVKIISRSTNSIIKDGVHFSVHSLLGGNIRVCTSDFTPSGRDFLLRGEYDVMAFYPGLSLLAVLEKHRRMLSNVQKRTNKLVSTGLNIERHVLLLRERMKYAARRIARMGGYAIAQEIDHFDARPQYKWAPPSAQLAALPLRLLADFDQSEFLLDQPLILHADVDTAAGAPAQRKMPRAQAAKRPRETPAATVAPAASNDLSNSTSNSVGNNTGNSTGNSVSSGAESGGQNTQKPEAPAKPKVTSRADSKTKAGAKIDWLDSSQRHDSIQGSFDAAAAQAEIEEYNAMLASSLPAIESSANWFYWVAALSLLNLALTMAGTDWSFALGLGVSQALSEWASQAGFMLKSLLNLTSFGLIAACAACGWIARRPSKLAFLLGMGLIALDTILLLIATDAVGLLVHAAALYYLWRGLSVVRQLQDSLTLV